MINYTNSTTFYNLNFFIKDFSEKKIYIQALRDNIDSISSKLETDCRLINSKLKNSFSDFITGNVEVLKTCSNIHSTFVMYVVSIKGTRSNMYLTISNSVGKLILSVSIGNVLNFSLVKGRAVKILALKSFFKLILKQKYLIGKPLALHIKNIKFIPKSLLRYLRKRRFLKSITFFHKAPFNGCRKKKVRSVKKKR